MTTLLYGQITQMIRSTELSKAGMKFREIDFLFYLLEYVKLMNSEEKSQVFSNGSTHGSLALISAKIEDY